MGSFGLISSHKDMNIKIIKAQFLKIISRED